MVGFLCFPEFIEKLSTYWNLWKVNAGVVGRFPAEPFPIISYWPLIAISITHFDQKYSKLEL